MRTTLLGLYADDAILRVVDSIHPPSHPLELHGKSEIGEFFRDVCGRDMTHHIDQSLESDGHLAFTEECQYPSGMKVLSSAMVDVPMAASPASSWCRRGTTRTCRGPKARRRSAHWRR